jgi:DNA-binding transcriptional LysR family regulator
MTRPKMLAHVEKLDVLRVLGESEGLRDAAARLGLSPSTLSEKISTLEGFFKTALVERGGARIALTPFARELVDTATPHLAALARLGPTKGRARAPKRLRIGAYESLALRVLPSVVVSVRDTEGIEHVDIRTGRSSALLVALSRGELDFAVLAGPVDAARFDVAPLASEELRLCRPKSMTEAAAHTLVAAGRFVGLSADAEGHPRFYRRFLAAIAAESPFVTSDSFEVVCRVALSQTLPCVLPGRLARESAPGLIECAMDARALAETRHDIAVARKRGLGTSVYGTLLTALKAALGPG